MKRSSSDHEERAAAVEGALLVCAQHAQHGLCSWDRATVRGVLLSSKALSRSLAGMVTQLQAPRLAGVAALPALRDLTVTVAMAEQFRKRPPLLVRDLGPLSGLSALTRLCLLDTLVDDVRVLAGLPSLRVLSLANSRGVCDLSPLSHLFLNHLDLTSTGVEDITALAHMSSLEVLRLDHCTALHRLTPHLPRLRVLSMVGAVSVSALTDLPGPALEELNLTATLVRDISPLSAMTNLLALRLDNPAHHAIQDWEPPAALHLAPLAALHNLRRLSIQHGRIEGLKVLSRLTCLKVLNLAGTSVSNLAPLQQLQLEELDISGNDAENLTPLAAMHSLRRVSLSTSSHLDGSVLSQLVGLESLHIRYGHDIPPALNLRAPVTRLVLESECSKRLNLSPCASLPTLHTLIVGRCCLVTDIAPLARLHALRWLSLYGRDVRDLTPLQGLRLERLKLDGAGVSDLRPLAAMACLTELCCHCCGFVSDLSPLAGLTRLQRLDLPFCRAVRDIQALAGLPLEHLALTDSRVRDLTPLSAVHTLECLEISTTWVQDLSPLAGLRGLKLLAINGGAPRGAPSTTLVHLRSTCPRVTVRMPVRDLDGSCRWWEVSRYANGWLHRDLISGCTGTRRRDGKGGELLGP